MQQPNNLQLCVGSWYVGLQGTMPHAQAPTLVLAECVLVYLDAAEAAGVVAALGSLLPNAVFAVYEQVTCTWSWVGVG